MILLRMINEPVGGGLRGGWSGAQSIGSVVLLEDLSRGVLFGIVDESGNQYSEI